jgi:hypothetical protein
MLQGSGRQIFTVARVVTATQESDMVRFTLGGALRD